MILAAILLIPTATAAALALFGHRSLTVSRWLSCGGLGTALVLALVVGGRQWGDAEPTGASLSPVSTGGIAITPALLADQLAASMLVLATGVAFLVAVYSVAYLAGDPRYPSYCAIVSLFTAAMCLVVLADDLFVLLVGWEVMGLCSWLLIAHYWERRPARAGAMKAFLATRLGDVGLLFGIFVLGDAAGTYRISGILEAVTAGQVSTGEATTAALLLLCGVVGKSAQFPLHSWLPDAMPGPTPISALIHAATMVAAGVYLVARLLPVFVLSPTALNVLAGIAAVTMVGGGCLAFAADDLKRVLAWSTVSQLAYMFGGLALGGYDVAVLHLLAHGAFKALLFLAAGSVIIAVGRQGMAELGGLRRAMPVTFATMTVGLATLAGLPPFVGFFSKDAILGQAAEQAADGSVRAGLLLVCGLVTTVLTAAYATRVWLLVFAGPTCVPEEGLPPIGERSRLITAPLVVLALAATLGGLAVVSPDFLNVDPAPFHHVALAAGLACTGLGIAASYLLWKWFEGADPATLLGPARPVLLEGFGFDRWLIGPLVALFRLASRSTAAAERDVVAPYVSGTEAGAGLAGRLVRLAHNGNLTNYLTGVVVGAVAIAVIVGVVQR